MRLICTSLIVRFHAVGVQSVRLSTTDLTACHSLDVDMSGSYTDVSYLDVKGLVRKLVRYNMEIVESVDCEGVVNPPVFVSYGGSKP
jgi:hypothetical protein